jgi:hypothetical protein
MDSQNETQEFLVKLLAQEESTYKSASTTKVDKTTKGEGKEEKQAPKKGTYIFDRIAPAKHFMDSWRKP